MCRFVVKRISTFSAVKIRLIFKGMQMSVVDADIPIFEGVGITYSEEKSVTALSILV